MKCVICDQPANKVINMSYSNIGPDGERSRWAGKLYVCKEHSELVTTMPTQELELFVRANAPPPVKEPGETLAETRFEPQRTQSNGNGA